MISLTDIAKSKMVDILTEENSSILRFGLKGGGCSGFQYFFEIEDAQAEDDFVIQLSDTHILVIDSASSMYLDQAVVDYKKDLMGESFVFTNPLQKGQCGCGASVSL